jgi:hypothetical protein
MDVQVIDHEYQCGDGCCDVYGSQVVIDGEKVAYFKNVSSNDIQEGIQELIEYLTLYLVTLNR